MTELSLNTARDMLAPLLENSKMLPRDIFDYKNKMHEDVAVHIRRILPLAKKEMLSFIKAPIKDIVCFGSVCSFIHHSSSEIKVAFIVDVPLSDEVLAHIARAINLRGFIFKIYNHPVKFSILKSIEEPNYSIMYNKWNITPYFQNFKFNLDFFLQEYTKLNDDFHKSLDDLPRNEKGLYTLESCKKIKTYFDTLKQKAIDAKKNTPEREYSLEYNLWLALNIMAVPDHFQQERIKSECYYLSGVDNA